MALKSKKNQMLIKKSGSDLDFNKKSALGRNNISRANFKAWLLSQKVKGGSSFMILWQKVDKNTEWKQ